MKSNNGLLSTIKSKQDEYDLLVDELENLKEEVYSEVKNYLSKYYNAEREVSKTYRNYSNCLYDYNIKYNDLDDFRIEQERQNEYVLRIEYTDRDNELFYSSIKIPKDIEKLDTYVEEFKQSLIDRYKQREAKEEKTKTEQLYETYKKLKDIFEKEEPK